MEHTVTENRIVLSAPKAPSPAASTFRGFRPPTSNTTYTPNQFFDVVIPNFSRGVVRIVGYLIRKTLGWCDANGNPQEEQIEGSYSELEHKAGISRDMIRSALDDALNAHILACVREGRPKLAHDAGQSALYALNWSGAAYTTRPAEFRGFFEGDGNRTDIPNEFFDVVIPNEPLSVIKVVGSVIRHSIGFQTKHGRRRQQVALSFQHIQNYAHIGSRSDLAKAVRTALEKNYIIRVADGVFSHRFDERRSATYALRWSDSLIGQKIAPAVGQSEKQTSNGQISEPVDQSEIQTSIETKPGNEIINRQPAADTQLAQKLIAIGFSAKTAAKLIREHRPQVIEEQIAWLPLRAPARSPAGLLRRAIEQGWPAPLKLRATQVLGTSGWEFARCFYAAYGGNRGEPVNEPSPHEAQVAEIFVERLVRASGGQNTPAEWGRVIGQMAREQRNPFPSLQLAIRQLGDGYLVRVEKQRLHTQLVTITERREQHEKTHRTAWLAWLNEQQAEMQRSSPDDYARYTAKRERERVELAADSKPWAKRVLDHFDTETAQINAFREFFGLPDFWQWDADINSQSFQTNA
ncbi:MAG: hypothetical protein WAW39_30815 [Prosthecobacter sp.]|uniref:hypothetical protein n=1 Tax=Prosthecobacter sp. TaxID=1965333 RepID=UPI003BAF8387